MQPLHFEACRVQPMTLPPPNFVPKHRSTCSVYGWGTIQNPQKKELKSELSVSQVQIRWVDDCWPFFPTKLNAKNHRSTICSAKKGHKLFVVIAYYHCCNLFFPLKTLTFIGRFRWSLGMSNWFWGRCIGRHINTNENQVVPKIKIPLYQCGFLLEVDRSRNGINYQPWYFGLFGNIDSGHIFVSLNLCNKSKNNQLKSVVKKYKINHIDFDEMGTKAKSSLMTVPFVLAAILSEIWKILNHGSVPNHCSLHFQSSS